VRPPFLPELDRRTTVAAVAAGLALVAVVTVCALPFRDDVTTATPALLLVLPVIAGALLGGRRAAVVTALAAAGVFDLVFIPPYWTVKVDVADDVIALVVFLLVAVAAGTLVAAEADRRHAAEQRAVELERLSSEVTRLAVLEQVDADRRALLRSVSHDLRTPLSTIRAVTSDLRSGVDYDEDTRAELLDLVGDEADRLDRLVANLLNMTRIEAGALVPERQAVDLGELVHDRVRHLSRLVRDVRLEINVPADLPLVDVDYTLVEQVLTNLLENAVRYAPQRTTVRVGARREGAMVRAWVADEGIGIPEYQQTQVFEPFRRGRGSRSSGVGLAICKAIVEAHGGTIDARSAHGGGTRFEFTLPVHDG
jgi:two-component system sensor histidine kinase KdpD